MHSSVPYLPIDEFEYRNLNELSGGFEKKEDGMEISVDGKRLRYLEDCDGYSQYVELVLQGMGMEKYASFFEEGDISLDILVYMTDDDLKQLGITESEDRKCMIEHLKQFRAENDEFIQISKKGNDLIEFNVTDDLTMAKNVCEHLMELNSHLFSLQAKLLKNPPSDYLIFDHVTGLHCFKFTINHSVIQSNRMSELLFGGQKEGRNLINDALNVTGQTLPSFKLEKLMELQKKRKKLRKTRLISVMVLGLGIGVAFAALSKKMIS